MCHSEAERSDFFLVPFYGTSDRGVEESLRAFFFTLSRVPHVSVLRVGIFALNRPQLTTPSVRHIPSFS
jgi:hypothetical protein